MENDGLDNRWGVYRRNGTTFCRIYNERGAKCLYKIRRSDGLGTKWTKKIILDGHETRKTHRSRVWLVLFYFPMLFFLSVRMSVCLSVCLSVWRDHIKVLQCHDPPKIMILTRLRGDVHTNTTICGKDSSV